MSSVAVARGREASRTSLAASLVLAALPVLVGVLAERLEYLIPSIAASTATIVFYRARRRRIVGDKRLSRLLSLLPDLLREGLEAVPGRLFLQARYVGRRPLRRLYVRRERFTPEGDPLTITLDDLLHGDQDLVILLSGDEGVIAGRAYLLQLEGYEIILLSPPTRVAARASRRRLLARSGGDYADVTLTSLNSAVALVASHVGKRSKARLVLEARAYGSTLSAPLLEVANSAVHYTLFFALRSPRVVITPRPIDLASIARLLGYGRREIITIGPGIEARLRLELRRGPILLDSDETIITTFRELEGETPST